MASRRVIQSPPPKTPGPKTKKYAKKLAVRLDGAEYEKAAEKLAVKIAEVSTLTAMKKESTKDFTDRIMIAAREQETLRKTVETHTKEDSVPCEETQDFDTNRITVRRLDTGEIVEERAMDKEERAKLAQGSLIKEDGE